MQKVCSECGKKLVKEMAITEAVSGKCYCSYSCLVSKSSWKPSDEN